MCWRAPCEPAGLSSRAAPGSLHATRHASERQPLVLLHLPLHEEGPGCCARRERDQDLPLQLVDVGDVARVAFQENNRTRPRPECTKPNWAGVATEDGAFDRKMLQAMAKRIGATVTEVPASHAIFMTRPRGRRRHRRHRAQPLRRATADLKAAVTLRPGRWAEDSWAKGPVVRFPRVRVAGRAAEDRNLSRRTGGDKCGSRTAGNRPAGS